MTVEHPIVWPGERRAVRRSEAPACSCSVSGSQTAPRAPPTLLVAHLRHGDSACFPVVLRGSASTVDVVSESNLVWRRSEPKPVRTRLAGSLFDEQLALLNSILRLVLLRIVQE